MSDGSRIKVQSSPATAFIGVCPKAIMHQQTVVLLIWVACACLCRAAPLNYLTDDASKQLVVEKFVEFLEEDKELENFVKANPTSGGELIRNKRDELEDVEDVDLDADDYGQTARAPPQEDGSVGFFDRAAKFVMEVLQRFLKWINSD